MTILYKIERERERKGDRGRKKKDSSPNLKLKYFKRVTTLQLKSKRRNYFHKL